MQFGELTDANYIKYNTHPGNLAYHKLSLQWSLFKIKIPLAWEITKGNTNTVITVNDTYLGSNTYEQDDIYHGITKTNDNRGGTRDLFIRTTYSDPTTGNIIYYSGHSAGTVDPLKFYLGGKINEITKVLIKDPTQDVITHGGFSSSVIFPRLNGNGVVGNCPNCTGIFEDLDKFASKLDYNPTNSIIDHPPIISRSYLGIRAIPLDVETCVLEEGMIQVECAPCSHLYTQDLNGNSFNDYMKDVKTLGVHAIKDGNWFTNKTCINWDPRIEITTNNSFFDGTNINPELLFTPYSNKLYPENINEEISCDEYHSTRWKKINNIYRKGEFGNSGHFLLDVVVPHDVIACNSNANYIYGEGESFSIARVSSIAGLMLSIDPIMYDNDIIDRPRKVYDIITFTADKIPLSVVDGECWNHIGQSYSFEDAHDMLKYKTPYDNGIPAEPLKRWWSFGAGYGMVNAYRCVAHSIRNKGEYEYTTSTPLPFAENDGNTPPDSRGYINEDEKMLMHFGSKNAAGQDVLLQGGDKYPGETDYNNCHGTTKLNGTNLALEVTTDCILAIDGIVKQDQTTKSSNKIYTSGNGKILMTGYLDEVELSGLVKTSNVKIYSSDNNSWGRISFIACSTDSPEIYDSLIVNGKGKISFDDGISTLMPGGVIYLKGDNDLVINDGATLIMDYSTSITFSPNNPRNIVIKPGGTLKIKEGAIADINCKVIAESNILDPEKSAQFIVEPNVLLRLKEFDFGRGSLFKVQEGSWVSLSEHKTNVCKGQFEVIGTSGSSATISGDICYCGDEGHKIKVTDYAKIIIPDDDVNDNYYPTISFNKAIFDNVPILILDGSITKIENCQFNANSNLYANKGFYPTLLDISFSIHPPSNLKSFEILSSTFQDKDIDYSEMIQMRSDLKLIGLNIKMADIINIKSSDFYSLKFGMRLYNSDDCIVDACTLKNCRTGLFNDGSKINLKNNQFNYGTYGSVFYYGISCKLINNNFNKYYHGIRTNNSNIMYLCDNSIIDFSRGIYDNKTTLILCPYYNSFYGNNIFSLSDPLYIWFDSFQYGYIDIEYSDCDTWPCVYVKNGRNKFSEFSRYHFKGDSWIWVNGNEYLPNINNNCEVRHSPEITLYDEFNLCNSQRDHNCLDEVSSIGIPNIDSCPGFYGYFVDSTYVWNNGDWSAESFTPEQWQDIIDQAIVYIGDSLYINCKCKIQILNDLMEAIKLSNDESEETSQRISDLFAHTKYWCNSSGVDYWIIFGLLMEYFDKLDDADYIYSDIINNYTNFTMDSIVANWRHLYLNAIQNDSTFGFIYDSLMTIYYDRIQIDLDRFPYQYSDTIIQDSIHYRRLNLEYELSYNTSLGQNIPNPFSDETEIPFYLKKPEFVKLAVYDAFGREIAVLVNEYRQPGKHSTIFSSPYLYNGVYFYRLEAGGIIETRKMQLIK
ncbi:MAG: T9SS type A sorting domain-containing protein [Bacteroidetes bacterium]|nr:MAG: T9SS type A sorting domain-containing protein [Bacteroidota bacterium]